MVSNTTPNLHVVKLKCPTCGVRIEFIDNTSLLTCSSCGSEHQVKHRRGSLYLAPIGQDPHSQRLDALKQASELSVKRLTQEIAEMRSLVEQAKRQPYAHLVPPSKLEKLLIVVSVLALCGAIVSLVVANMVTLILFAVILCGALVACILVIGKRFHKIRLLKADEIQRLQNKYEAKVSALEKKNLSANH